jgi:glycosyltransferase involved in cell wall biosynthesis
MKICFFARVPSRDILSTVGFYSQDIHALKELGHEVVVVNQLGHVPVDCDLYYIWWWTWALEPLIKAKMRRRPAIITGAFNYQIAENSAVQRGFYVGRPLRERLPIKWSLKGATANIFHSEFECKQVSKVFGIKNGHYVPCAVNTDQYRPSAHNREPFLLNIAWSGELNGQRKCLKQIIEAFALVRIQHPGVRLKMAGRPGEYHPVLVETAKNLGLLDSIDFLGVIPDEEKISLMQRCSAYLQPSLFEGFGLATAEAMACGASVISSPVGAVPEVVGDAGILVNGRSPEEIAQAVDRILQDRTVQQELGQRARERIERLFTYERKKQRLQDVVSEVVNRNRD